MVFNVLTSTGADADSKGGGWCGGVRKSIRKNGIFIFIAIFVAVAVAVIVVGKIKLN